MSLFQRIIHGNCIDELQKLPAESVELIFADPPYWMRTAGVLHRTNGNPYDGCADSWDNQFTDYSEYCSFTREWLTACYRVLAPNGALWVIGSMQCIYTIGNSLLECGFWIINDVVWHKKNPTPNFYGTRLNNSHETLIWAVKSQKAKYTFHYKTAKELNTDTVDDAAYRQGMRKQMGSVWRFPLCAGQERLKDDNGKKLHSTQKPQSLLYRIIVLCSNLGDTVLDPFGGTMTTGAAAKQCGRSFIGIELSAAYCEAGRRRIAAVTEHIGAAERAEYDQRPPRVSLAALLKAGYLIPHEQLFLKNGAAAAVQEDGSIILPDGTKTDIHAGVSLLKAQGAKRTNGYLHWYVRRDGHHVLLDSLREQFRQNALYQESCKNNEGCPKTSSGC